MSETCPQAVARPAIFSGDTGVGPALFYVSFIIVCQIVLINVVVAVLLDKMVEEEDAPDPEEMSVIEKLHQMLAQEYGQLQALFRSWDDDGSGTVSRREWCKAIQSLGYRGPRSVLHQIFDSMDRDRSGTLSFDEVYRQLRAGHAMRKDLDPLLIDGAAGEITLVSKNKVSLRKSLEEQFLIHVRSPRDVIGAPQHRQPLAASSPEGDSPTLPAIHLTPRTSPPPKRPHYPPSPHSGGTANILASRAHYSDGGFVVPNCINGAHRKTLQQERAEVAADTTYMEQGPGSSQFYRTRTSFLPATTYARWEQPLPEISSDGSPLLCRHGGVGSAWERNPYTPRKGF